MIEIKTAHTWKLYIMAIELVFVERKKRRRINNSCKRRSNRLYSDIHGAHIATYNGCTLAKRTHSHRTSSHTCHNCYTCASLGEKKGGTMHVRLNILKSKVDIPCIFIFCSTLNIFMRVRLYSFCSDVDDLINNTIFVSFFFLLALRLFAVAAYLKR